MKENILQQENLPKEQVSQESSPQENLPKEQVSQENLPKVAFICNHNSCRSQIAEALGKHFGKNVFQSYSAGTTIKNSINEQAVRLVKKIYGIDMEKTQYNKKIEDIPQPDVVIFMGCNVSCPMLKGEIMQNWQLVDPTGSSDCEFEKIIYKIEQNIFTLIKEIKSFTEEK